MDGKPLYEYARENKPLPRAIDPRAVTISELVLEEFTPAQVVSGDGGHAYEPPSKHLTEEEVATYRKLTELTKTAASTKPDVVMGIPDKEAEVKANEEQTDASTSASPSISSPPLKPATFKLRMSVSSGTYVRSIVHDIGLAIGSAAHVVKLTRTRQGQFTLEPSSTEPTPREEDFFIYDESGPDRFDFGERKGGVIPWEIMDRAIKSRKAEIAADLEQEQKLKSGDLDEEELMASKPDNGKWVPKEWEREFFARFVSKD
jgi:tRNA pseudouridine55 synthase